MRKEESSCEICRRLGKTECGYHQFKNQSLSRFSKGAQENQFAQTQSSIHRNQPYLAYSRHSPSRYEAPLTVSAHTRTLTPTKIVNSNVNFSYQQTHSPFRPIAINTPNPHSRVIFTPPRPVQPISQLPPPPQSLPQHLVRV